MRPFQPRAQFRGVFGEPEQKFFRPRAPAVPVAQRELGQKQIEYVFRGTEFGEPGDVVFGPCEIAGAEPKLQINMNKLDQEANRVRRTGFEVGADVLVIDVGFDEPCRCRITTVQRRRRSRRIGVGADFAKAATLGVKELGPVRPVIAERRIKTKAHLRADDRVVDVTHVARRNPELTQGRFGQ